MLLGVAEKIKKSRNLVKDPDAGLALRELLSMLPKYTVLSSYQFQTTPGLFNAFIEQFLNSYAYIGAKDGLRYPSYDPIKTAYTETIEDELVIQQWFAVWTNVFIIYTEYPASPDLDVLIIAIDNETYNTVVKVGKDTDELLKQSVL